MREKPLILIADDDAELVRSLSLSLQNHYDVHTTNGVAQAKSLSLRNSYDAIIIDLCFEGQELDGIHLIDHLSRQSPGTYLIVLSGDSSVKRVVEAMRRKLFQFIYKDGDFFEELMGTLRRVTQLKKAHDEQKGRKYLTESPTTLRVLENAQRILRSHSDATILILGETGSGKEFLAQHIAHATGKRLVAANMASIPKDTAESILFGHERGAFTGALNSKVGLIESANGGIFFLDEIGECPLVVQTKLLRALQEKEVQPLGSNSSRRVKVQFVAATHQDLNEMVGAGTFRLDLMQRLNAFVLHLPPLRDRPEDIMLYANLFLDEIASENESYAISPDGMNALLKYTWPGNIRELRNVIQRIVVLSSRLIIDAQSVNEAIAGGNDSFRRTEGSKIAVLGNDLRRQELLKSLRFHLGNKRLTAKSLGISEATLYRWVNEFGLKTTAYQIREGVEGASEAV